MKHFRIFWIGLLAVVAPLSVQAVDNEWINNASGFWTNVPSWNQGRLPIASDRVFIYKPVTVTVDNAAANLAATSFTNTALFLYNSSGSPTLIFDYTNTPTFYVNGQVNMGNATLNWNAPNATFQFGGVTMNGALGTPGPGEMNLIAGRWYSPLAGGNGITIGSASGSSSVVNLYTNASLISLANVNNEIGALGNGQINILGGTLNLGNAIVGSSAGGTGRIVMASGRLVLTNAGQVYLGIGSSPNGGVNGYGELIISNGSLFSSSAHNISIGGGANFAGGRGRGVMKVYGGSHTNTGGFYVGASHNSTGHVLIAGGTWDIRQRWLVGGENTNNFGSVTVSNGTLRVKDNNIHLLFGNENTSYGELNVAGGSILMDHTTASFSPRVELGVANGSTGRLRVTGGLLEILGFSSGGLLVATNASANGSAVLEGGLVRVRRLDVGVNGVFSNRTGGVLQFLEQDTVLGVLGNRIVDGGTLSYKNYSALNVTGAVSKFSIVSGSILQLDSSTNVNLAGTYALANSAGNFKELSLTGDRPRWQSDSLLINPSTTLHVSNASNARVSSTTTNLGTILVENSTVTYEKAVTIGGSYISDPSTNTFLADATVSPSGSLAGGAGDVFDFKKSLYIHSTNTGAFNLVSSTVSFSGGGVHTNAVTGVDLGHNGTTGNANGFVAENFAYGRLTLGSTNDVVCFECGDLPAVASNGVYIVNLDLSGFTNYFSSVSNMITSLLHAPTNVNIYYASSDVVGFNDYLNDQVFQLTDCNGNLGGFLMSAIPEPSTLTLLAVGLCAMLKRRRHS